MQNVVLTHDTPVKTLLSVPSSGLDAIAHEEPSQFSISVCWELPFQ